MSQQTQHTSLYNRCQNCYMCLTGHNLDGSAVPYDFKYAVDIW